MERSTSQSGREQTGSFGLRIFKSGHSGWCGYRRDVTPFECGNVVNRADLRQSALAPELRLRYQASDFNTGIYFAPSLASTAFGILYSRITASCLRKPHNSRWMK